MRGCIHAAEWAAKLGFGRLAAQSYTSLVTLHNVVRSVWNLPAEFRARQRLLDGLMQQARNSDSREIPYCFLTEPEAADMLNAPSAYIEGHAQGARRRPDPDVADNYIRDTMIGEPVFDELAGSIHPGAGEVEQDDEVPASRLAALRQSAAANVREEKYQRDSAGSV